MKIKEIIIENKEKIGIALIGLTVVGVITYLFVRKSKKPVAVKSLNLSEKSYVSATSTLEQQKQLHEPEPIVSKYDPKFTKIINEVRAMLDQNGYKLTPQVITAIIRGQYELGQQDMKALVFNSRRERRQKLGDGLQFARIVARHQFEQQQLQQKHQGAILSRFNIDKATWKEASDQWQAKTQEDAYGIGDLIRDQQEKLLLSYRDPNQKLKDFNTIEKILKFKIRTLEILNPQELGIDLGADAAAKFELIQTYINDLVFNKFNTQAEDLEYSIEQLSKQEKEEVIKYEDKITEMMENFVGEDEQEKQGDFY